MKARSQHRAGQDRDKRYAGFMRQSPREPLRFVFARK